MCPIRNLNRDYSIMLNKFIVAIAATLIATAAYACDIQATGATASFASPAMGVGYVTLKSANDDTLTGLKSNCCEAVELHSSTMENGVMKMRKLETLELTAGKPVAITKAGGMHFMFINPHMAYKPGDVIGINLTFAKAGEHTQLFTVGGKAGKPAAKAKSMDHDMGHDMSGMDHTH